jgi:CheY-like chemotaxis protein
VSVSCESAQNGAGGLVKLKDHRYAVLLIDLMMPMKNGLEVLQELRTWNLPPEDFPVVLLMTAASEHDTLLPVADLVHAIIRKPFDVENLAQLVAGCVAVRQSHDAPALRADIRANSSTPDV